MELRIVKKLVSREVSKMNAETDTIPSVKVFKNRKDVVMREVAPVSFQKFLLKEIADLSTFLIVNVDQDLFRTSPKQDFQDILYNRIRLEQGLECVTFKGNKFYPVGASGSLKEGTMWFASSETRDKLHKYFSTAEAAATYLGILMNQGFDGSFKSDKVVVYDDIAENDGMGYIRKSYAKENNLHSQMQVRIVDPNNYSAAKGTLLPMEDKVFSKWFGDKDIAINQSLIKTDSKKFEDCIISVKSKARYGSSKSSFQVLQFIDEKGFELLKPLIDRKMEDILGRFMDKGKALESMKARIRESEDEYIIDTKTATLLFTEKEDIILHPYIQKKLRNFWTKEIEEIALGGAMSFHYGMAAFNSTVKEGEVRFSNGSVMVNPKDMTKILLGDYDGDLLYFAINRASKKAVVFRYPLIQSCSIMSLDIVGDIPESIGNQPLTQHILANHVRRDLPIDSPESKKKKTNLAQLVNVLLNGCQGSGIGASTLAISAAQANEQYDLVRELAFNSECEVMSFKHHVLNAPELKTGSILKEWGTPEWFGRTHEVLDDFEEINYPGTVAKCYNYVSDIVKSIKSKIEVIAKPLSSFKDLVKCPSFTRKEFLNVYSLYKDYNQKVVKAIEDKNPDSINAIIKELEDVGTSLSDAEVALAWYITHRKEGKGIGSFAIHINLSKLVGLMGGLNLDIPGVKVIKTNTVDESKIYQKDADRVLKEMFSK